MASTLLNVGEMKENVFGSASMIGISSVLQGYRICWVLNRFFDTRFVNVPEQTICMGESKAGKESIKYLEAENRGLMFDPSPIVQEELAYFPTYCHQFPNSSYHYLLYQLKFGKKVLLPEVKHLDYLWLFQTAEPQHDAHIVLSQLRGISDIQMAQELTTEQLKKSIGNLLV